MEICSFNHEEIVFDIRNCPLCQANKRIEELEYEVNDLESDIQKLKERGEV